MRKSFARATARAPSFTRDQAAAAVTYLGADLWQQPPWPNGQGVGPLIRRLRVRVPQGVHTVAHCQEARPALSFEPHAAARLLSLPKVLMLRHLCRRRWRRKGLHQPGIEPGSHRWQRCILPLDH